MRVRVNTMAKTIAWVRATVMREPPGGRETRTPGVNTKKSTARYRDIYIYYELKKVLEPQKEGFPVNIS